MTVLDSRRPGRPGRPIAVVDGDAHHPLSPMAAARRTTVVGARAWGGGIPIAVETLALFAPLVHDHRAALAVASINLVTLGLWAHAGMWRPRLHLSVLDDAPALLARRLAAVAVVVLGIAVIRRHIPTDELLADVLWGTAAQLLARSALYGGARKLRRDRPSGRRTLILGGGRVASQLAEVLRDEPEHGLTPLGFLDDDPLDGAAISVLPHLGPVADLRRVLREQRINVVVVAFGSVRESALVEIMRSRAEGRCEIYLVPRLFEVYGQHGSTDHIGAVPVVRLRPPALQSPGFLVKRAVDIVVSLLALLVLSPVLIACAIAVRIEGGPGVIFKQVRVGHDGRPFQLWKFRSLRPVDEAESSTMWNVSNDDRLGRVGRLLRRTSLDELPQLVNILRGDMTFVGPRPERPHFVTEFSEADPRYSHRLRMPAGLTGLAQVSGLRGDTSIADRVRYDNFYIENWSLWLDAKVVVRTVREVVFARGA